MQIGTIRGQYGQYPVLVLNGAVYYRDSSNRTVTTGFTPSKITQGRYSGPDGSSFDLYGMLNEIQRRYDAGKYRA